MEEYKAKFIDFLFQNGLLVSAIPDKDRQLKSKRISPWFLNVGEFNDGLTLGKLAEAYADVIVDSDIHVDSLFGIPEKGVSLVGPVAVAMANKGKKVGWFFTRKIPKEYGEATGLSSEERRKKEIVGRVPQDTDTIGFLDDVFTTGDAKYGVIETLQKLGYSAFSLLAIALDRQEVGIDGKSAIEEYESKTGIKVISSVKATDVLDYLSERLQDTSGNSTEIKRSIERLSNYLRVYGTLNARKYVEANLGKLEQKIIERDRSVIPACDVSAIEEFEKLVEQTADVEGIGGYKIGFELGLGYGLENVVGAAKKHTSKPIIYDHQKAGTDIPDTGKNFAKLCKKAGVDAVILFPQSGPETERAWIYHSLDNGLKVIVGGEMTHQGYKRSEGGFISDDMLDAMYLIGARAGVSNFVVPGNKIDRIAHYKEILENEGVSPVFYAPGFIAQGGKIEDAAKVAGDRFHGIVGRGIYKADDMKKAAIEHTSQL